MFKSLFGKKQKVTKPQDVDTENIIKESKQKQAHFKKVFNLGLDAKNYYEQGNIHKAKSLLETAIFRLDSDIPGQFNLLIKIYKEESNIDGIKQVKKAALNEVPKERNKLNGSDKKFQKIVDQLDKFLAK